LGTITEWLDNSAQINAEQQVQKLIGRAVSGNLDERLELEGMVGFMRGLGKGINMLMDAVQSPLQAIKDVQIGLAESNLTKQMDGLFLGEFGSVQNATNQSIRQLTGLVEKVRASANAVEQTASTLRQGNDLLKQRTNQQVDALDDAASAVEELTSTALHRSVTSARRLDQIANEVHNVSGLMSEIAVASQEQYLGTEQLKKSVVNVLQGLQKNQELVGDVTDSSKSLNAQAEALVSQISFFKVDPSLAPDDALENQYGSDAEDQRAPAASAIEEILVANDSDEHVEPDDFMIDEQLVSEKTVSERGVSAGEAPVEPQNKKSSDSAEEFDFFV